MTALNLTVIILSFIVGVVCILAQVFPSVENGKPLNNVIREEEKKNA